VPDAHLGTLWVDIIARDSSFLQSMTKVGSKMTALGVAMTKNVTLPIAAAGAIGYKAAAEIGKGYMLVARQLGYTGKELDKLMVRFRKVWRNVPEDSEVVAGVLINIEQRFNQTGKAADKMTKKVLDFARIMGADPVTVSRELGMWFQQNAVKGEKQAEAMDMLAYAAQKSGVPLDRLITLLQQNSTMLKALGFNTKEQIALFASFESAGLGAEDTAQALRMAVASASDEGFKTGEEGLRSFVKEIKAAPNQMEATKRAIEIFGRLAGPKLAAAIRDGTFSVDKWVKKLDNSKGTVKKTADATMQLSDRMKMLGKKVLGLFEPIGKIFIYAFEDIILPALEKAANYTDKWADSMDKVPRPVLAAIGTVLTLIALVGPLTAILGWLGNFAVLKYGQVARGIASIYSFVFLKTAALAYATGLSMGIAFGLVLLILAAVGGAIYIIITNWDKFAKVFQPVMGALADLWKTLKKTFGELWAILKPLLIPALKKLAIIVGIALLGAFGGLAIVLILLINIITAVIKCFVGLGKVVYGVSQVMRGFFTGNQDLMDKGVKNIRDGTSEIGSAMKDMVMNSGKQIGEVIKGVAEGTIAMMDDFNKDATKKGQEGGKASGKAFEDMSAEERKKGMKEQISDQTKQNKKMAKESGKGGKDAGRAYRLGFAGAAEQGKGAGTRANEYEMTAHLHRRQAYWDAYIKGDFEAAKKQLAIADRFQKKADRLRGVSQKKETRKKKEHQRKQEGIAFWGGRKIEGILRRTLNKQSGIFLLSRKNRLALQKGFQVREQFATRNHQKTLASIFRFFKNKVAILDRLFNAQSNNRRNVQNTKERGATKWHWSRIVFITGMALFGPAGLLNLHLLFGGRLLAWLRQTFTSQRNETRNHWTIANIITRLGLARVFLTMRTMILNFGSWLVRVPKMFYNYIMRGGNWLYRAGKKLVNRMIKGIKDRIKGLVGAGKKAGKGTRKGYRKGGKGAGNDGKSVGDAIRKGFRRGTKKGKKDGEKAGKKTGEGFKKGAKKGQKQAGVKTAKEFIQGLKRKLGIRSPSEVARKLGVAVSRGFTNGVGWKALKKSSGDSMDTVTQEMQRRLMRFTEWLRGLPKLWKHTLLLNAHYMGEAGISLANTLIGAVKARLGIASPSKEFQEIGKYMIMGLIKGMSQDDLMSVLYNQFGGWEAFAKHILEIINGNMGQGWAWLTEFLGTDAEALFNALNEKFGTTISGGGQLAGVDMTPGIPLLEAIFAWATAQLPGESHSITSRFREGAGSWHGRDGGRAIDIAPGSDALAQILAQLFGVTKGEWGLGMIDNEFGELIWQAPGHYDHIHLAIIAISDFLQSLATGGGDGGDVWGTMKSMFKGAYPEWPEAQFNALNTLIGRESSFDPQAQNPNSTAWGLFQFLDFNWPEYLPQGKASTVAQQIEGGIKYIRDRYHSSALEALQKHDDVGWYQGGGAVSATLHSGERVLTMQQNRWFTDLARPLGALTSGSQAGRLPVELKVAMPAGTTFKIKNLKEGIVEVVDEGIYKHVEKTIAIDEWVEK